MPDDDVRVIGRRPAAEWPQIAGRVAADRQHAGLDLGELASEAGLSVDELSRFEAEGDPVLGAFELEVIASALGTSVGAWVYDDQPPCFRGMGDATAADEAAETGRALMLQYLALAATVG